MRLLLYMLSFDGLSVNTTRCASSRPRSTLIYVGKLSILGAMLSFDTMMQKASLYQGCSKALAKDLLDTGGWIDLPAWRSSVLRVHCFVASIACRQFCTLAADRRGRLAKSRVPGDSARWSPAGFGPHGLSCKW